MRTSQKLIPNPKFIIGFVFFQLISSQNTAADHQNVSNNLTFVHTVSTGIVHTFSFNITLCHLYWIRFADMVIAIYINLIQMIHGNH